MNTIYFQIHLNISALETGEDSKRISWTHLTNTTPSESELEAMISTYLKDHILPQLLDARYFSHFTISNFSTRQNFLTASLTVYSTFHLHTQ